MNTIKRLLELNIEIEGLLRVIENRDTSFARELLSERVSAFNELYKSFSGITDSKPADAPTEIVEPEDSVEPEQPAAVADVEESATVEVAVAEQVSDDNEEEVSSDNVDEDAPSDLENDEDQAVTVEGACTDEPSDTTVPASNDSKPNVSTNKSDEPLRVDELLSRREAQDLRRAFTLNDKFRYRRELFNSNDVLFAETLNTLSEMQTLDEALDYLYNTLGWNPDDDNVKDFVLTVTNHFATKS